MEGEHDSAISIYSSACKVLPGTHLPKLYLGIEHARLKNWTLALEFLNAARESCQTDPLLENELAVVYYQTERYASLMIRYDLAITHFHTVLELVRNAGTPLHNWTSSVVNLGHAYRKERWVKLIRNFIQARHYFEQATEDEAALESAYAGLALISYSESKFDESINYLHQALALNPENRYCATLLDSILSDLATKNKGNPLPVLQMHLLNQDLLDQQLQTKLGEELPNPPYDPDEILFADELKSDDDRRMLTRSRVRGRLSHLETPQFGNDYLSSPMEKTPPRMNRSLFANQESRETSPFGGNVFFSNDAYESDVFGGDNPDDIEMDLDNSSE